MCLCFVYPGHPPGKLAVLPHPDHLTPSVQRADEVNKVDPKVAYYCRMYAIEQVMTPMMHYRILW